MGFKFIFQTLLFIGTILIQIIISTSQELRVEYARNRLPVSTYYSSPVYDGDDSIYIFGGIGNNDAYKKILKFSISSETVETVGQLFYGSFLGQNGATQDSTGRIFYIGGGQTVQIFEPSVDSESRNVSYLPYEINAGSRIPLDDDKVLLIGGDDRGQNLMKMSIYDMKTQAVEVLNKSLPFAMTDCKAARLGNKALVFGYPNNVGNPPAYILDLETLEAQLPPADFDFPRMSYEPQVISNGYNYFLVAGESNEFEKPIPTDGIVQFDPEDFTWNFLKVDNFPIKDYEYFHRPPSSIYIDKLNRIYSFGGISRNFSLPGYTTERDEIWYIDLSPVTPTEAPTSTLRPDIFSCSNRTDGLYPHPESCTKFIGCHGGVSEVYDCPQPLLFDPVEGRCDYSENVMCDLTCIAKPDGQYPHPHDCSLFFICKDENLDVFRCPDPLLFNPETNRCEFPETVQCSVK